MFPFSSLLPRLSLFQQSVQFLQREIQFLVRLSWQHLRQQHSQDYRSRHVSCPFQKEREGENEWMLIGLRCPPYSVSFICLGKENSGAKDEWFVLKQCTAPAVNASRSHDNL